MWDDVRLCLPAVAVGVGTSWRRKLEKGGEAGRSESGQIPRADAWGPPGSLSTHQILECLRGPVRAPGRTGVGQSAPPALATVCLSLCFPLASPGLCPHLVHHVPLRGVAPVSESAVRCSVYLKGSSWSALSHSNPDIATHTGMYLCPRPRPPRQSPPDPIFPVITTNS